MALFPAAAVGRIRPGQAARLRLEGFPWTQYGLLRATVSAVGNEADAGLVRVELAIEADPDSPIPVQHGLPGSVEIAVEKVSPAILVLRRRTFPGSHRSRSKTKLLAPVVNPIYSGMHHDRPLRRRRLLVPDVIQTSAMDCGPAVLKCLLEGYGIPVHYGRLREACQTDIDGTSIDVLEETARQFGLEAEQEMMPVDHLLLGEADALPAILVVLQPGGFTHFVLVWRRHGPWVQVMDPAIGRKWTTCRQLMDDAYVHSHRISAAAWREWAVSEGMCLPLARRLHDLGLGRAGLALIDQAAKSPDWRPLAAA